MKIAKVRSVCECQARLAAELDEGQRALRGWAKSARGAVEVAPCNAIGAGHQRFDLGWLCPLCGRNTLRSFDVSALVYEDVASAPQGEEATAS